MKKNYPLSVVFKYAIVISILVLNHPSNSNATGGPGIIVDTTPPVITLLGQIVVTHPAGTPYIDPGATASDNLDGDITAGIVTHNPVNNSIPGTYTLTYNVTDNEGNAASQVTRTVNVIDNTPPVITLLGQIVVTHPAGTPYVDQGATASDNLDGDITAGIVTHNPVNNSIPGTYTLTYNVTDNEGNAASQVTRTVNVIDNTPPVITLLGDPAVTLTVGTAYTDPGATAADNLDGDITPRIIVTGLVDTSAIGSYTIAYNVADNSGNFALEVTRSINVVDVEKYAPVAYDGSLLTDEDTPVSGFFAADDEDNDNLSYSILSSGSKGSAFLIDQTTGEFSYIPDPNTNGSDTFTFRVTDGLFDSNTASVSVTISPVNDAPIADAGPDQTLSEGIVTATLSATNSADVDDDIDTVSWEQTSGPSVDLSDIYDMTPTFLLPDVDLDGASLTFLLTVTDSSGLQSQDTCIVNVTWINAPPTADAGNDQTTGERETVYLDGTGSYDLDDGVSSFEWSQISGPEADLTDTASARPEFTVPDVNQDTSLTFQLIVTDNGGLQATDTCVVNISWMNTPPVADAGPDQTIGEDEPVRLDGSGSYDMDDGIQTYHWHQTLGIPATLSNPMISSPDIIVPDIVSGETVLTFELTVSDNNGLQSTDACTITVVWVNEPPVSDAGSNRTVIENDILTLNGTGSSDPDDGIETYRWVQTTGAHVDIFNPDTATPHFTAPSIESDEEILSFMLTVTDGQGLQSSDTVFITVANDSAEADTDGDGIPDYQDLFPNDPNEWADNDNDGTGDNSDPDDDNDTMPDSWEETHGLNPFVDDALLDADEDGSNNLDEYLADTDPTDSDSFPVDTNQNTPPDQPDLYWPVNDSLDISLTPILQTAAFYDADTGDKHTKTKWQIAFDADFSTLVFQRDTKQYLTMIPVPPSVLKHGTQYYWRARFYDNYDGTSEWSEMIAFTTLTDETYDVNLNGIPDGQEVDTTTDLDENEIPDLSQDDILSLNNIALNTQIGIKKYKNVIAIESAKILDLDNFPDIKNNPEDIPFGLISFRIMVRHPGDEAAIKICLSEPAPEEALWYKYDSLTGFYAYSDHVIMSHNRKCLIITLKDGGFGDDDGVENGIIVDPSGLLMPSVLRETNDVVNRTELSEAAAGETEGGCFIYSLVHW